MIRGNPIPETPHPKRRARPAGREKGTMVRRIKQILLVVSGAGLAWAVATATLGDRAFRLYHGGRYHTVRSLQPPPSVAEHSRHFQRDLSELCQFALSALEQNQPKRWQQASGLLNETWLSQRDLSKPDLQQLQTLLHFQQRVGEIYALAARKKKEARLPEIDPRDWAGRTSLAHRLLVVYRVKQWEEWEVRGGLLTWVQACRVLKRLDQWHSELDQGQPLSQPDPHQLKPYYEAITQLQKGP